MTGDCGRLGRAAGAALCLRVSGGHPLLTNASLPLQDPLSETRIAAIGMLRSCLAIVSQREGSGAAPRGHVEDNSTTRPPHR